MASRNSPIRKLNNAESKTKKIPEKFKQISFLGNHINENGHMVSKATENMSVDG